MRVAVLGAGASGLAAIKISKEYGFDVVCFEKSGDIGGLWRFKSGDTKDEATVMKSTIINTSKEMLAFSDFPPPAHFPNYMHNTKVMEYFRGEERHEKFDGVFLCNGHHVHPNWPHFDGLLDRFQGRVFHSNSYRDHRGLEDQTVIVVGIGNSGGDIAVELSKIAKQVYLVTRRGTWVLNRVGTGGLPNDFRRNTRFGQWFKDLFPDYVSSSAEQAVDLRFDHELYGLKPKHRMFSQHPMVNDDLPNRIISGSIQIKGNVKEFTENGAIFEDGSAISDLDTVILCTGYTIGFPVLGPGIVEPFIANRISLFKYMFPPGLEKGTLGIIGCIQPWGATVPISELQCRVLAETLIGNYKLPSKEIMLADINAKRNAMARRYVQSQRHTIQVDFVEFMDELGSLIGVKPNLIKYFLSGDFTLLRALIFGPCVPYQYRLNGPKACQNARKAILTVNSRIVEGFRGGRTSIGNYLTVKQRSSIPFWIVGVLFFLVLFAVIVEVVN